jgi:hypothetical protein
MPGISKRSKTIKKQRKQPVEEAEEGAAADSDADQAMIDDDERAPSPLID